MMKRIGLLLTLAAFMATVVVLTVGSAFAAEPVCSKHVPQQGQQTCVLTDEEVTTAREVVAEETVVRETPATRPCQVGNSGRQGTQAGIESQEVLVTTTALIETTVTTTTTTVFRGVGNPQVPIGDPLVETSDPVKEEVPDTRETTETPVGEAIFTPTPGEPCKNTPGPQ